MARVTRPAARWRRWSWTWAPPSSITPIPPTTRIILDTFTDAAVQGRIGRQLPRLFTLAGLTDMSVTPTVILSNAAFWRILYQDHVARLQDQLVLPGQDADRWRAGLVE